jgi:hypothetical protein
MNVLFFLLSRANRRARGAYDRALRMACAEVSFGLFALGGVAGKQLQRRSGGRRREKRPPGLEPVLDADRQHADVGVVDVPIRRGCRIWARRCRRRPGRHGFANAFRAARMPSATATPGARPFTAPSASFSL